MEGIAPPVVGDGPTYRDDWRIWGVLVVCNGAVLRYPDPDYEITGDIFLDPTPYRIQTYGEFIDFMKFLEPTLDLPYSVEVTDGGTGGGSAGGGSGGGSSGGGSGNGSNIGNACIPSRQLVLLNVLGLLTYYVPQDEDAILISALLSSVYDRCEPKLAYAGLIAGVGSRLFRKLFSDGQSTTYTDRRDYNPVR
jgi:hypothetical protein